MSAAAVTTFFVEGIAFWAPTLPGWPIARAAFRGEGAPADPPAKRPAPELLAAAERRRAPDTVALALEVASAAVREAGLEPGTLPSIFTSAHGDLGVNDYMCKTLATQPALISPTKFHNSVHNAAAGYWTIGTGCMAASSALTAFDASFAAGLLEAATQCAADARAVLLVAFDVEATGPLATVTTSARPRRGRPRAGASAERAHRSRPSSGRWRRGRRHCRRCVQAQPRRSPAMRWPMPCRFSKASRPPSARRSACRSRHGSRCI